MLDIHLDVVQILLLFCRSGIGNIAVTPMIFSPLPAASRAIFACTSSALTILALWTVLVALSRLEPVADNLASESGHNIHTVP